MHRSIRRTTAAGIAVAALSALSACGGGGDSTKATDTSATDGLKPGAAVPASDARDLVTAATRDLTAMRVSADMAAGPMGSMHMEGVEQAKPSLLAQMSVTVAGQKMEVRMIGTDLYMQLPAQAAAAVPGGKKWVTMSFDDLGSTAGVDMSGLADALQNPAASIDKFAKYITGGTYVGPAKVDGVDTKQYDFVVDAKGAMAQMMPGGLPTGSGVNLPDSVHESVWIDDDGHPVQMKMEMGDLGTTTMHLSDFGAKVDVTAPPAGDVADLSELMKGSAAKLPG